MSKADKVEFIAQVVEKMCGSIDVECETNHDNQVLANLDVFLSVLDILLDDVYRSYDDANFSKKYASAERVCDKEHKWLESMKEISHERTDAWNKMAEGA